MMRGHAHGGHAHGHAVGSGHGPGDKNSTADLRRQHDELDRLIGERESE
jgi:hypothetical protein